MFTAGGSQGPPAFASGHSKGRNDDQGDDFSEWLPGAAYRALAGHIKPGTVESGLFSGLDWYPTLLAAAGNPDITDRFARAPSREASGNTSNV